MRVRSPSRRRPQAGMSLIEVLASVLIFSFGLIGLMGLQARALQFSTSAEDTSRAAALANELASLMVMKATINTSSLGTDYTNWNTRVSTPASGGLPNGAASVTVDPAHATNAATIKITWLPTTAASGASPNQYFTYVVLP